MVAKKDDALTPPSGVKPKSSYIWQQDTWSLLQTIRANQLVMMGMLRSLATQGATLMVDFTAANLEIAKNTTVTGSVVTLMQQLTAMLKAIPPSNDPATQASLDALVATLTANDTAAADAVVANTPAAPAA